MGAHAKLQPSSAYRWLVCPGSVELCASVVDSGGQDADEGTACHEAVSCILTGQPIPEAIMVDGKEIKFTLEMLERAHTAAAWVIEYKQRTGATIFSEKKVEIGAGFGLKDGLFWGTADVVGFGPDELLVADAKFGYVAVDVETIENGEREPNEQLASYALGVLDLTGWMHSRIRLAILQPRHSDVPKEAVYTADELEAWRTSKLEAVHRAAEGGPLVVSDDGCRWCKGAGACPKLREHTLALAKREFTSLITLSGDEIADLLCKVEMIEKVAPTIRNHAMKLLEIDPDSVPGFKRVLGDKKRKWKDEGIAKKAIGEYLSREEMIEESLKSPAQIENAMVEKLVASAKQAGEKLTKKDAKEQAKEITDILAEKPKGEPTLVKKSDERPALAPVFTKDDIIELDAVDVID